MVVRDSRGGGKQEGGIGIEDEWMDGVQREQPGGRCDIVIERGRKASQGETVLTLYASAINWKTTYCMKQNCL